jgi:hypothetical protein
MVTPDRCSVQSDLALFGNIRLAWKGLPETYALTLLFLSLVMKKRAHNIDTRGQCYKTFFIVTDASENKLECLLMEESTAGL